MSRIDLARVPRFPWPTSVALLGLALAGCWGGGSARVTTRPLPAGVQYATLAVIAGADARSDISISAAARKQLKDGGWNAIPFAGRWESEEVAAAQLCSKAFADGLVVIYYDHLRFYGCPSEELLYESIVGGSLGMPDLVKAFMAYMEPRRRAADSPTPVQPAQ